MEATQKSRREIEILNPQIVTVLRKKTAPWRDDVKLSVLYIRMKYSTQAVAISIGMIKKVYLGSTQGSSKQRYYNHKSSFTHEIYRHKTNLSNYVWDVKNKFGIDSLLKCEIVERCSEYKRGGVEVDRYCKLWMEEKWNITTNNRPKELVNQRFEVFNICRHKKIG